MEPGRCASEAEFETFILSEHFHYFPHKRLCLEAKDRSEMPNEACPGEGACKGLGREEERRVRLPVHIFARNHLKIRTGDENSGTHGSSLKLPSGL